MARPCSTSRPKAIATAGLPIRPPPFLKNASPNLKAASAHSRSQPDRRRCISRWSISPTPAATSSRCRSSTARRTPCLPTCLPRQGITTRFADSDKADAIEKLIDENTKAVFAETIGNPAGNVCDIEALAKVAHRHGVPLVVDNTVATPILLKPFDYGADIAVHSLTKFLGGHGTTLGGAIVDSGRFPWTEHAAPLSRLQRARRLLSRPRLHQAIRHQRLHPARAQRLSAHHGIGAVAVQCLPAAAGHRNRGAAHRAACRERSARSRTSCATIRASPGSIMPAFPTAPIMRWSRNT